MYIVKIMTFCNKDVVWADPLPSCGQIPHFYIFWDPSLTFSVQKLNLDILDQSLKNAINLRNC